MRKTLHIVIALVTLLCAWGVSGVFAQSETGRPFITKWWGEAGKELKIPIFGREYKLVIKNEKGEVVKSEEKITRKDLKSPYAFTPNANGVYSVEAGPEGVEYMRTSRIWGPIGDPNSLREVVQFGTVKWESMYYMFQACKNMTFVAGIDTPDLSDVTNMERMFYNCASFNQPLNNWNVSNVTDMRHMFDGCTSFNQPLGNWNVSNVTNMEWMFNDCSAFNQPLDNWNVSNVTEMNCMFADCSAFNQPLNNWNVSNMTEMGSMFHGCTSFNQPLNNWNVSKVTDMVGMFSGCSAFNQPLNNWNVSNVTDMGGMFAYCSSFNQPLENWSVSKVTEMNDMFHGCTSFNQPLNNWNVSKVTEMSGMFQNCTDFDQPLNNWNVSKVTEMGAMFSGCCFFNQPLGSWKIRTAVGGLNETAISPSNYSQTLMGWAEQTAITEDLDFDDNVKGLVYNDHGKAAREKLMDKGWEFYGDIHQPSGVAITPHTFPLVLNKEFTLPLEKWGVKETEEVKLSTDPEGIISYKLTANKKGVHIKGLKEGTCQLTAIIAAKAGVHEAYTSTCEINVYIPIEHFTLTPASKTLKVGEEFTFTANLFPENATKREVKWRSNNSEIATVDDNGKVTAHKAEECTVDAVINEYGRTVKRKCKVTVVDAIAPVASITILEKQTLKVGARIQLVAVVTPDNAEQGCIWSSSDPEVATVSEGVVWGKKKGKCTITVRSLDPACTITKECKLSVK